MPKNSMCESCGALVEVAVTDPGSSDITAAWQAQSKRLKEVQIRGGSLEKEIKEILGWDSGRVVYHSHHGYDVQMDSIYPSKEAPEVIVSVTYTDPDTKGHSNENKLQLKVGELALIKYAYPQCRVVLVIGGSKDSWLPYVLEAFKYFFDDIIFVWEPSGVFELNILKINPDSVALKHKSFWEQLSLEWHAIELKGEDFNPPTGLLRYKIADKIKGQNPPVDHPDLVNSRIAALCLNRSKRKGGAEWNNFRKRNWNALEQSRSYFNPLESLVEISLTDAKLSFEGGIAHDISVPSFLHQLGMENTLMSEDFVLFSEKFKCPVYIQCKASGGGRDQHGKNIQNRAKEQVSRGILYRSTLVGSVFTLNPKYYIWISVLDGNWGVTKRTPRKYIHMLQFAGYDHFFGSEELVDSDYEPLPSDTNPLTRFLIDELDCRKKEETDLSIALSLSL
ncbi:hypothetical protein [Hymenobacter cellulosivorans]|uniref:Restriction endonuclease n=1 Tax=Hymenobacter cellulosivorans TaxID=2932249 RepID=A0ABY4FG38_9BACT|nr:hypothetical protein [Hymenobacter cellulosivorans]UOQ53396.1 hypothetical protein MUN80_01240 [Hymenobacter cellulosivorans]